jgi:sarcosine oxidase
MARRREVVVIGAGVMGSATAWALAREGTDVVLIERFAQGHDRGSSHGASRVFRLAYPLPLYAELAAKAQRGWRAVEEESGTQLLTRTGGIDLGDPEPIDRIAATLTSIGASFEFLPASDASRRWPGMRIEGTVLYQPDTGVLNADAAVAAFQSCAVQRGAELHFDEPVTALRPHAGHVVVETSHGDIDAETVVVTAGAWLVRLISGIASVPPLRITQEQPAYFPPRDPAIEWPVFIHRLPPGEGPTQLEGMGAYGLPTLGFGMKVGEHGTGPEVDPDRRQDPDATGLERVSRYVERWLPGLDPAPTSVISCLYTTTPDEHFVIDRVGRVVVGSPCSGHGFKFAPAIGHLLADLARGRGSVPSAWRTVSSPAGL